MSYTLYARPYSDVTTWLPYLMAGTLQCTLLMLCIYLRHCRPRRCDSQDATDQDKEPTDPPTDAAIDTTSEFSTLLHIKSSPK